MFYIKLIIIFIITTALVGCNLTPQKYGGYIPEEVNIADITINIIDYTPNDLSLLVGDRAIKNSSFVISNFANTPDFEPGMVGVLGVLALDSNYEVHLPKKLEEHLATKFNLSKILFTELESSSEHSLIKYNDPKNEVNELTLESYALINITKKGVIFNPQIIASLYDNHGKFIWQNHYGFPSKVKTWDEWSDLALNDFFITAYKQLIIEFRANLNGELYHHKIIPDPIIELNLPETL